MPNKRLICMGLLSKYPLKSSILQKIIKGDGSRYTTFEKMHITATWFTPGLTRRWLAHQFEQYSDRDPQVILRGIRRIAYNPKYRKRWAHLGQQNILFMGQPEVERYYARHPRSGKELHHPIWVIPILQDHKKQGMSMVKISKKYGIPYWTVDRLTRTSIFEPKTRIRGQKLWKSQSKN